MYSFNKLNKLLDRFEEMKIPSFDIEVRYHGETVFRRMHGYSDYDKKVKIKGGERYYMYSCSKPITCCAALVLFERGKLSLEDKLCKYLPEFENMHVRDSFDGKLRPAVRRITIEDLFTMCAGFTYDLNSENLAAAKRELDGCETREVMKYLAKDPLVFDPSDKYNYSLCHDVLAAVVQVIAGEPFGSFVKREIFDRAGMENSTFSHTPKDLEGLCAQYNYNSSTGNYEKQKNNPFYFGEKYESGGAGCISTLEDYMRFAEALRVGNVFLSDSTIELMSKNRFSPQKAADYSLYEYGYGYGLGVRCPFDGSSKATDIGWGGAAAAYLACDRKCDFTVFYAQHVLNSPNQLLRNQIPPIIRHDLEIAEYGKYDFDGVTNETF